MSQGSFLVEGVSCVGEVKSFLNTDQLERAIKAGVKFKQLKNRNNTGDEIFTNPVDLQRFYGCPPFFVFAMECDINEGTLLARLFQAALDANIRSATPPLPEGASDSYVIIPPVDGVFVLGKGAALMFVDGSSFGIQAANGERVADWAFIHAEDDVVTQFLMWLHACMPRVRRFNSIAVNYLLGRSQFTTLSHWLGAVDVKSEATLPRRRTPSEPRSTDAVGVER